MTRLLFIFSIMTLLVAFTKNQMEVSQGSAKIHKNSDVKMGNDATGSGTDISDYDIQAEEDRREEMNENQESPDAEDGKEDINGQPTN